MKGKSSPLSKVSHLASNTMSDKATEKENSANEAARKFWESVIRQTSQEETTSSKQKEEQTTPSQSDGNSSKDGATKTEK